MGAQIELNTMLRLGPNDNKGSELKIGGKYTISKSNRRIYLMDIAILLLEENWDAIGYCAIRKTTIENGKMEITFELLSRFSPEEQRIVTNTMLEGMRLCGYLPAKPN